MRNDQKQNPRFDKATYRRRNVVKRCVAWLKENRRLATRFEKLAVNFLAMVKLAMIQRCLRLLDSADRALGPPGDQERCGRVPHRHSY